MSGPPGPGVPAVSWLGLDILPAESLIHPLKMFFFFGGYSKQWHLAMAGLLLAIIPVIIFYFIAQKHIIEGITAGANK